MPEATKESTTKSPYDWSEPESLDKMAEAVDNQDNTTDGDSPISEKTASESDSVGDNPEQLTEVAEGDKKPEEVKSESNTAPEPEPDPMKAVDEYLDEELARVVQNMRQEISGLQSQLKVAERAANEVKAVGRMDRLISMHGGEYAGVLKDSEAKAKVESAMKVLEAGFESTGQPVPNDAELFRRATRQEYGDSIVESQKQKFADSVQKREDQIISRVSGHSPSLAGGKPEDRAALAVHRMMKDRGLLD
jgi:hypothetical protein